MTTMMLMLEMAVQIENERIRASLCEKRKWRDRHETCGMYFKMTVRVACIRTDRHPISKQEVAMPDRTAKKQAEADRKAGKSPSTQAGHFVEAEIEAKRKHKGPAKSNKQAVAIGLSKARKAGVKVPAKPKSH